MKYMMLSFLVLISFAQTCNPIEGHRIDCDLKKPFAFKGITLTAPSKPFPKNPMPAIKAIHSNAIAVIPYGFTRPNTAKLQFNIGWQWWGEKEVGVRESIRLAQEAKIKVMLKPQVYIPGGWTGTFNLKTNEDWEEWEKGYTEYILFMAAIAEELQVALFCFGTEFKTAVAQRPSYWPKLIKQVKSIYTGPLVYAANWDAYEAVPFWNEMDYIGINAYFPLINDKTPTVEQLKNQWKTKVQKIGTFACTQNKPVLFTEFGYLSVDGCAYNTWELEKKVKQLAINEQAQANAIQALYESFREETWWAGGFLWKWFPNEDGHEGYFERDYTPQTKLAAPILSQMHQEFE